MKTNYYMMNLLSAHTLEFLALQATMEQLISSPYSFFGPWWNTIGGGDISIADLHIPTHGHIYNMLMEFSNNYSGHHPYVTHFCEHFRQGNYNLAILCETEHRFGEVFMGRHSVIPAIKYHFLTYGNPFR